MDIKKWLNETADARTPPGPGQTSATSFFQHPEKSRPVFDQKRAAKRKKSDSSLLNLQTSAKGTPPKRSTASTVGRRAASEHSEASRPSQSDSAGSKSPRHQFARKPRHKTRLERYKPKHVKGRGDHAHQSRKDESKKPRRKSKCKKGDPSGSGIAVGFHAKNVSRDRLTVRAAGHADVGMPADDWW